MGYRGRPQFRLQVIAVHARAAKRRPRAKHSANAFANTLVEEDHTKQGEEHVQPKDHPYLLRLPFGVQFRSHGSIYRATLNSSVPLLRPNTRCLDS
jgi:hypothetical protein